MRPKRPPAEIPPPLEMECLKALWRLEEGDVTSVREALLPERPLAYTTVMTILDRLVKRGSVERRKLGRKFLYTPAVSKEILRSRAVRQLIDGLFEGSEDLLLEYLNRGGRSLSANVAPPSGARMDAVLL